MLDDVFQPYLKNIPLSADLGLVDRVSGNTTWIQHGAVLADWWNTRIDNPAAGSWPVYSCWVRHSVIYRDFEFHRKSIYTEGV